MDADVVNFFLYLVAFIVSVVVIIAICQLFAIRRLLEVLVKQSGGSVAGPPKVMADLPARKFKDDAAKTAYLTGLDDSSLLATWKTNPSDMLVEHEVRRRGFYVG
jgi:hypothetical protein